MRIQEKQANKSQHMSHGPWSHIQHCPYIKLYPCKTFKITQTKTCQATHPILKALAFNPRYRFHGTNTYTYIFFYSGKPPTGMSTCIFPTAASRPLVCLLPCLQRFLTPPIQQYNSRQHRNTTQHGLKQKVLLFKKNKSVKLACSPNSAEKAFNFIKILQK